MILGVVLAGGKSTRFGGDKAQAKLGGKPLIDRAIAALQAQCDAVVVAGRKTAPVETITDWPAGDMGPLGGIAAGLRHAEAEGFASVLTCGVDSASLPDTLLERLSPAPSFLSSQPVIGHWPVAALTALTDILRGDGRHSMLAFATAIGAREVKLADKPANINTKADLAAAEARDDI